MKELKGEDNPSRTTAKGEMEEVEIELEGEACIRPASSRSKTAGEMLGRIIRARQQDDKRRTLHVGGTDNQAPQTTCCR